MAVKNQKAVSSILIRASKADVKIIDNLKAVTGEKVATKALMMAAVKLPILIKELDELRDRYNTLDDKYQDIIYSIQEIRTAEDNIKKHLKEIN